MQALPRANSPMREVTYSADHADEVLQIVDNYLNSNQQLATAIEEISPVGDPMIDVRRVGSISTLQGILEHIKRVLALKKTGPDYRTAKNFVLVLLFLVKRSARAEILSASDPSSQPALSQISVNTWKNGIGYVLTPRWHNNLAHIVRLMSIRVR